MSFFRCTPPAKLCVVVHAAILAWSANISAAGEGGTILGIDGSRFTLNGNPTFLLGFSYYGALGATEGSVRRDLDDAQRYGFDWLRVWATWESFGTDDSAVDTRGQPRSKYLEKLQRLVAECDRRGLVLDVTLARGKAAPEASAGGRLSDFESHQRAVECVVNALKQHRNWYVDLANERDVRDERYVPTAELKSLRDLVRRLDPPRLVTASFGGRDLTEGDVRDALLSAGLDFLSPHRPRNGESPAQTAARTRECRALMKRIGRIVPVHYQEPFRRGYGQWEPSAADFLTDLHGAVAGGAAGWCFHNGSQRNTADQVPRRSFDLRSKRLFEQLDPVERKVVADAASHLRPLFDSRGVERAEPLDISWEDNLLTIRGKFAGNVITIMYLEAYCRPGSTNREWGQTVIPHRSEKLSVKNGGGAIHLQDTLADGVVVRHVITSTSDEVDFQVTAHNPTDKESQAHWAQPCIRVDRFTGAGNADARELVPAYAKKCFLFVNDELTRLPTTPWADEARYTPGQVYCPKHVDLDDVNSRSLSTLVPSSSLCGCFSVDEKQILAVAWEPFQEIFQGVIACIHSDFRVGGLQPGEKKQIRGKLYIVPADVPKLVARYKRDFAE